MYYAIICHDKPGHTQMRQQTRPRHLSYLQSLGTRLKFAGPFSDEQGNPNGSLVVVEAGSQAEAETIAANDPYAQQGLFSACHVHAWTWAVNNPAHQ